ncbi:electron transport complex, RnfABCDGE type, G subunit [Magnetococcus marinus MC-1]|uniref:Ion-translocating oxidoreductase complex subunit G n=1 Tax=Magnetococcus marinus (strain ATCC BAA-1437 / JCM 17883 / MC-1) TaxID=156889 RepID=A0L5G4_MAGMM|nr:electron transport complex subunit RsxG [Magnetococcus marinus]ABK43207.1 electron transport complex, RnfABCDGE type, G subunit [Magnetococcus marinus MC-1]
MPSFIRMGLVLMAVGAIATTILATTNAATEGAIAEAVRLDTLKALRSVLPVGYDNDPVEDTVMLADVGLNKKGTPVKFYRSRKGDQAMAAAFVVTAPDGYSGDIDTIMAVSVDGTVTGIQVVNHKETPGLGDKIEASKSDWAESFRGKRLDTFKWGVKKDGGGFDQFAGATITPRAVVKSVKYGLEFFVKHQAQIFAQAEPVAVQPAQAAH